MTSRDAEDPRAAMNGRKFHNDILPYNSSLYFTTNDACYL